MDPDTLFDQDKTYHALDDVDHLAEKVQRDDGQAGKTAQKIGAGDVDTPHEYAVEQECNHGLAAGTQGEIGSVHKCRQRHAYRGDSDKISRQHFYFMGCVIQHGEEGRGENENRPNHEAGAH